MEKFFSSCLTGAQQASTNDAPCATAIIIRSASRRYSRSRDAGMRGSRATYAMTRERPVFTSAAGHPGPLGWAWSTSTILRACSNALPPCPPLMRQTRSLSLASRAPRTQSKSMPAMMDRRDREWPTRTPRSARCCAPRWAHPTRVSPRACTTQGAQPAQPALRLLAALT